VVLNLKKNTPANICFIASHFPQGGAERQILELIKGLLKKEYKVTLILYQSDKIFYKEILELDIKLILNKDKTSNNIFFKWINNIVFLRKNLKNKSFEILHTYLFFNGLIVRIFAPNRFIGKIIYSIRNSYESVSKLYFVSDRLLNRFSINIYNSKKSLEQLFTKPSKSILKNNFVIYNGYDTNKFCVKEKKTNKILTIGMVGRLTFQKNQIQALRVLNKIKNETDLRFKIYLIGDNTKYEALEIKKYISKNLIEESILLEAQKEIQEYYRLFDLFLLPSLYEGCPNVLFEALLTKCLCIVSEGANSDSFIKDRINGFVYDGSDKDFEKKLNDVISLIRQKGHLDIVSNGYNYASQNFSTTQMIENYHNVYQTIR